MPNPPLQQTGRTRRASTRSATVCGRLLNANLVSQIAEKHVRFLRNSAVGLACALGAAAASCDHVTTAPFVYSLDAPEASPSSQYLFQREGVIADGRRTIVFSRDPRLGELSVAVSASVSAAEATELLNFLFVTYGPPYSSRTESISSDGASGWSIIVAEPNVGGRGFRVAVARNQGALQVSSIEAVN